MNNRIEFLIGTTVNNTLVFAEVDFGNEYRKDFSICFNEVRPFVASDEYLQEQAESTIDCFDNTIYYCVFYV